MTVIKELGPSLLLLNPKSVEFNLRHPEVVNIGKFLSNKYKDNTT